MRPRLNVLKPPLPCRRARHNPSSIPSSTSFSSSLNDISSPHWSSEALVPQYDSSRKATSLQHSLEPSSLSEPFLRSPGIVDAANAVVGVVAEFQSGLFGNGIATATAFEVGPGGIHPLSPIPNCCYRQEPRLILCSLLNTQSFPRLAPPRPNKCLPPAAQIPPTASLGTLACAFNVHIPTRRTDSSGHDHQAMDQGPQNSVSSHVEDTSTGAERGHLVSFGGV